MTCELDPEPEPDSPEDPPEDPEPDSLIEGPPILPDPLFF
jgi:hypothetical protein